jgi:isopenicillin N synthase-like dioxygenase
VDHIPVIDLSAAESPATTHAIEAACRDIGFMVVAGHGIPPDTISGIRDATVAYFEQPEEHKLRDRITRNNYRGYIPQGFFSPANADAATADRYEGYKLHLEVPANNPVCDECDLYGPNKWPESPPGFRDAVLTYWQECDRVANRLLCALAKSLGIDTGRFLAHFESPLTNMTLLHYPPQPDGQPGFGIHPHKDTDALTILYPDAVGGLMVRQRGDDDWLEVRTEGSDLVVNIGDLLELWSGGYFVSTPHKVVNTSGAERYSFPYFAVPRFDTVVRPLIPSQPGFDRASVHVGDVSREVWRTNWPEAVPADTGYDLGTLED